jgi:XrtN system VIT domain protein
MEKYETVPEQSIKRCDSVILCGYVLLGSTVSLYAVDEYFDLSKKLYDLTTFFIHYFISIAYAILLIANGSFGILKSWHKKNLDKTIILLNLFVVSAYALNRKVPVFSDSTDWFCVYLIVTSLTTLSYKYYTTLPRAVNIIQQFFLGIALALYAYLAVFVANYYFFGAIGMFLFGVGGHILLPIFLIIGSIGLIRRVRDVQENSYGWVVAGILTIATFVGVFMTVWSSRVKEIERVVNQSAIHPDTEFPAWVKISESISDDWLTACILKSEMLYMISKDRRISDFVPKMASSDEEQKHDPLVYVSSFIGISSLSQEDRKKILQALTDNRQK